MNIDLKTLPHEKIQQLILLGIVTQEEVDAVFNPEKSNISIKVEKYLSDNLRVVDVMTTHLKKVRKNNADPFPLLVAGTGTGKTNLMHKIAKKHGIKCILAVPNVAVSEALANSYDGTVACFSGNRINKVVGDVKKDSDFIFTTVDQLRNCDELQVYLKDRVLILDEAHYYFKASGFRYEAVKSLELALKNNVFKNVVFVTATPEVLKSAKEENEYSFKTVKIERDNAQILYKLNMHKYNEETESRLDDTRAFLKKLASDGKVLVYLNKSKANQEIISTLEGWHFINSDTKENEIYKSIVENELIPDYVNLLFVTDIITAGNNIRNEDFKHVVFIDECDHDVVKQFSARLRSVKTLNIHVIHSFNPSGSDPEKFIEMTGWRIKKEMKLLQRTGINEKTVHGNGLINGLFFDHDKEIYLSTFAHNNLILENKIRYFPQSCFKMFESIEIDGEVSRQLLDMSFDKEVKKEKEKKKLQDEVELEEFRDKLRRLIVRELETLVKSQKSFDDFCKQEGIVKKEKKYLSNLVNIIENSNLDVETDYNLMFEMASDQSFNKFLRYRATHDVVGRTGVKMDDLLHTVNTRRIGTVMRKEDLPNHAVHNWEIIKGMLRAVFMTGDIREGRKVALHLIRRRPSLEDEYGERISKELRNYYIKFLKHDPEEIERQKAEELRRKEEHEELKKMNLADEVADFFGIDGYMEEIDD